VGTRALREVREAVEASADALRQAGHMVVVTDPPYPASISLLFLHRFLAGIAEDADRLALPMDRLQRQTQSMVRVGRWLQRNRPVTPAGADRWRTRVTSWFRDYDVLLTPSLARPAGRATGWVGQGWIKTLVEMTPFTPYTPAWNVASLPAASVPSGAVDGLPVGTQVVGPPGAEEMVLSVCMQLEQLRPWARHAPGTV
jgi:amidase